MTGDNHASLLNNVWMLPIELLGVKQRSFDVWSQPNTPHNIPLPPSGMFVDARNSTRLRDHISNWLNALIACDWKKGGTPLLPTHLAMWMTNTSSSSSPQARWNLHTRLARCDDNFACVFIHNFSSPPLLCSLLFCSMVVYDTLNTAGRPSSQSSERRPEAPQPSPHLSECIIMPLKPGWLDLCHQNVVCSWTDKRGRPSA